jgi:hypothetical protein
VGSCKLSFEKPKVISFHYEISEAKSNHARVVSTLNCVEKLTDEELLLLFHAVNVDIGRIWSSHKRSMFMEMEG